MITREKCCICNGNIEFLYNFDNYPINFGMSLSKDYVFKTLSFGICKICNNIQLNKLINLDELYSNNAHNNEIIGKTWHEHFISFSNFINSNLNNLENVLEIGSPTDKILKYFDKYNTWTLLDPNVINYNDTRIITINSYLDEEFTINNKYNTIINSHLLEHLYYPNKQLSIINKLLLEDGNLFISVPNMEYYSKTHTPFLGIHFEHTYYLNVVNMIYLLNNNGFYIKDILYFNNHSIFYHCQKTKIIKPSLNCIKQYNLTNKYNFNKKINEYNDLVKRLNIKLLQCSKNVYIFGCHTNTQIMIYLKLNIDNITIILDNDTSKHNKYFYGTNLLCKSPNILNNIDNPKVICYIGNYTEEVKEQLKTINENIEFY